MNPVPIMRLVEVIRGLATSDETFNTIEQCLYFRNEQLVDMEGRGVFTAEDGELVNINRSFGEQLMQ